MCRDSTFNIFTLCVWSFVGVEKWSVQTFCVVVLTAALTHTVNIHIPDALCININSPPTEAVNNIYVSCHIHNRWHEPEWHVSPWKQKWENHALELESIIGAWISPISSLSLITPEIYSVITCHCILLQRLGHLAEVMKNCSGNTERGKEKMRTQ